MRRASAVCLAIGPSAVLSHGSAARLLGFDLPLSDVIEVTVPHGTGAGRGLRDVVVHQGRYLPEHHRTRVLGLPVTAAGRTLIDLARRYDEKVLIKALDAAILDRILNAKLFAALLSEPRMRARAGSRLLRQVFEPWLDQPRVESVAEMSLIRMFKRAGIPRPVSQYEIRDGKVFVARVDFAWPELKVAVEMNGFRFHSSPRAHGHDSMRMNDLGALEWNLIGVTPYEIEKRPAPFLERLRKALGLDSGAGRVADVLPR